MYSFKQNQIRSMQKKTNEFELTQLVESTEKFTRRICRIPTRLIEAETRQTEEHIGTSTGAADASDGTPPLGGANSSENVKVTWKLEESHPRFGPLYIIDQKSVEATKKKAWEHILKKTLERDPSLEPEFIMEIYSLAIRKVEQEAKEIYGDKVPGTRSSFRWMMIKDGCLFLQLALLILGCSNQLGYAANDPIFGLKHNKKDMKKWVEAMFYVGNQIPLVVLSELMNQSFFQDVIKKAKWDAAPQTSLCKKVLYDVLVLPALKRGQGLSLKERIMRKGNDYLADHRHHASDLLQGLQNMLIGLTEPLDHLSIEYETDDGQIDLEANEEEVGDDERIFPIDIDDGTPQTDDRIKLLLGAIGLSSSIEDQKRIFPCATELRRTGIHIKKLKSGGARGICFRSYYLWPWAYLYLPVFVVGDYAETILGNLKTYELSQQQIGKNRRQVGSYIRVMSDIIQTTRDAKLLEKEGIVRRNSDDDMEKLPRILSRLSSEDVRLTHEFVSLRRKIRDYSSPWLHYKGVINLVVFLTLLQTCFALLAYFKPPKP